MTSSVAIGCDGKIPPETSIQRVTIRRAGMSAVLMTWGATLQGFYRDGDEKSFVLGSSSFDAYLADLRHCGAIVGRVANRIADGRAMIGETEVELERNENEETTLHGGSLGASVRNWELIGCDDISCVMQLTLGHGEGGFPGNLMLHATYYIEDDGALRLEIEGSTDATTLCNPAHHPYWNLNGSDRISDHRLRISADHYLPIGKDKIPLGHLQSVEETRFDFRSGRYVALPGDEALDHNFCLSDCEDGHLREVCSLDAGGARLTVETTEPGLQVYDGAHLGIGAHCGLALEPQRWPDAPNHPNFPSILLKPGTTYRQTTRYRIQSIVQSANQESP